MKESLSRYLWKEVERKTCNTDLLKGFQYDNVGQARRGLIKDNSEGYKADGILRYQDNEILLVELCGAFKSTSRSKLQFDRHEGMYGVLGMLKHIRKQHCYASLDTFNKLKIFFIYTKECELQLWSIQFIHGMFFFQRVATCVISEDFVHGMKFICPEEVSLDESIRQTLSNQNLQYEAIRKENISLDIAFNFFPTTATIGLTGLWSSYGFLRIFSTRLGENSDKTTSPIVEAWVGLSIAATATPPILSILRCMEARLFQPPPKIEPSGKRRHYKAGRYENGFWQP
ncbi:hypothetical protein [Parasitella parasitica]|uniref:Uncharacterized protein n=1 Tax=Parasitella parasitica TaxID=35722 RepID=A0A0B7NR36_9FUNG|nr:hypothetical protein [Parasitella parasitica]